ncbi:phosphotransferase [Ornithinibacillus sp. 16A2E]|uniref:Phosphotransferase n=2 Tax=Ornithinibacillus xuwenensis TaxID=3144668 RepID=A0ABU9XGK1_9BACI
MNATKVNKLSKGYSTDQKYIVHANGNKYLLRVGASADYKKKQQEFHTLKGLQNLRVRCPKPYEIKNIETQNISYTIYAYIDGKDAKEIIHTFSDKEQYHLGIDAGKELYKLHQYAEIPSVEAWESRILKKHYQYLQAFQSCGIKIKQVEKIIDFIEENKQYLIERPNRLQHDDFHLGNIILSDRKFSGVIDFDNLDWGDPIHDFVKVGLFVRGESIPFSIGQVHGYYNFQVPESFWRLYSIYMAMVIFSSVVWTIRFVPDQLDEMMERLNVILEDHQYFELWKPLWYQEKMEWSS